MKFSPKLGVTLAALAALGLAASNAAKADAGFQVGSAAANTLYTGTNALLTTPFSFVTSGGGTVNGITLVVSAGVAAGTQPGAGGGVGTADQALVYDGYNVWVTSGLAGTETFSGLTPGALYNVALYGSNDPSGWAVGPGAAAATVFAAGFPAATPSIANSSGLFNSVAASGTGTIVIDQFTNKGAGVTAATEFTGAQIAAAVPEASSAIGLGVLLALGGLAVVARKRTVKA